MSASLNSGILRGDTWQTQIQPHFARITNILEINQSVLGANEKAGLGDFAGRSAREETFAEVSAEDRQMLRRTGLNADRRIWQVDLQNASTNHPRVRDLRLILAGLGFNPASSLGAQMFGSHVRTEVEKAKSNQSAYNANECARILAEQTVKPAGQLYDEYQN